MYKVANGMFQLREKSHYNLHYTSEFIIPLIYHGSESVSYLGPKIWEQIPPVIRQIEIFSGVKKAIKNGNLLTAHAGSAKHTYLA